MDSPTNGSISTPHWDGITRTLFVMNSKVKLTVPGGHRIMFSMFHIHLKDTETSSRHDSKCRKDMSVLLYEESADDPFKVYCGTLRPGPSAYTPRSDSVYVHFDYSRPDTVTCFLGTVTNLPFYKGFKLHFSFHTHSAMLTQSPPQVGKWNCSVPQWQEFRHHFPCNLQADCLGREDEAACPYTTPECGEGRVSIEGRCFAVTTPTPMIYNPTFDPFYVPHRKMCWIEAKEWCQREGGHLASIYNHLEMMRILDFLSNAGGYSFVFFGLVPNGGTSSLIYKGLWQHVSGVISHFLEYPIHLLQQNPDFIGGAFIDIKIQKVRPITNTFSMPFAGCLCDVPAAIGPGTSPPILPHLPTEQDRYFKNDGSYLECPGGHMTHTFLACDLQSACWANEVLSPSSSTCLAPVTPLPPEMMCDNRLQHVPYTMVCDRRPDCFDYSDEDFCVYKPCLITDHFQCRDKSCVPYLKKCNWVTDCRDETDEQNCGAPVYYSSKVNQPPFILLTNYGGTLRATEMNQMLVVNGKKIKGILFNGMLERIQMYSMQNFFSSPILNVPIILNKILDKAVVMMNGTLIIRGALPGNKTLFEEIGPEDWKLNLRGGIIVSGVVTEIVSRGRPYLVMKNVTITSGTVSCPDTHFYCSPDYCIPVFLRCNDVYDCPGREDEAGCESYQCPGFYRCRGAKVCVHRRDLCDSVMNCPQSDDELLCDLACPDGCTCYGLAFFCPRVTPVSFDTRLRYLDVSDSSTSYSAVVNNTMLIYLSLVRCDVIGWGPVTLPNLRTLDLSENYVTAITRLFLRHLPKLRHLTLARNPLMSGFTSELNTSLPSLRSLDITNVLLPELDSSVLNVFPTLYALNLSGCSVDSVTGDGFQHLKQLHAVDLRGCPMTFFPRNVFHGLSELSEVHADNYKLCCQATLPAVSLYSVDCDAPTNEVSLCQDLLRSEFLRICLYIFAVLSCAGNLSSLVFKAVSKSRRRTGFDMFVANLCLSDFLMGIYLTIIGVADRVYMGSYLWNDVMWRHSAVCTVAGFLSLLSSELSAFIICLITLDRFLVISFPFSQRLRFNSVTACIACALIWMTGLVIAAVPLLPGMSQWQFYSQTGICVPLPITRTDFKGRQYTFSVMIVLNFVLFVAVALGQLLIYLSVQKHRMPTIGEDSATSSKKDLRLARRLITVAVSDFLCWFPIGLLGILASNGYHISGEINVAMAIFVLPLNSAVNPFLYTINIMLEKVNQSRDKRMHQFWLSQMKTQDAGRDNISRVGSNCTEDEARAILNTWLNKGVLSPEHLSLAVKADDALCKPLG